MLKGLAYIGAIMKQAQQMGGKVEEMNAQLRQQRAKANAGGGMVEVEVNGLGEVLSLTIDPTLIENKERDMIEDLIPAAVNQAIKKSHELRAEAMKGLTAGFDLPGLDDALAKFSGSPDGQ
ncbi:MAG: YbaB/EbfC family nucleoid-associated protein [Planctomycetales bacterium]|nr:YbaB/EbfC family nucleoid-associated protein [Planctomycetales bacterium]